MFRSFFLTRRWLAWSVLGTALILYTTWYRVQLDVRINEWFGTFYDLLQKALGKPGSITIAQYWQQVSTFLSIAMIYVTVAVVVDFFIKHYVFRWRQAMNQYYMATGRSCARSRARRSGCRRTRCASPPSCRAWAST